MHLQVYTEVNMNRNKAIMRNLISDEIVQKSILYGITASAVLLAVYFVVTR